MANRDYTWKGRSLPLDAYDPSKGYYSLISNKMVLGSRQKGIKGIDVGNGVGPYIYGKVDEHIKQFLEENHIPNLQMSTPQLNLSHSPMMRFPLAPQGFQSRPPVVMPPVPSSFQLNQPPPLTTSSFQLNQLPSLSASQFKVVHPTPLNVPPTFVFPKPLVPMLYPQYQPSVCETKVCPMNTISAYYVNSNVTDVTQVPQSAIDNMCDFHFKGLYGKGKVIKVSDGDTIRLLVYIPLSIMAEGRDITIGRQSRAHTEKRFPIITSHSASGFFSILKIRLLNIDTAEKNTPQGKLAKKLMIEKYQSLNNIVYYVLHEPDKYGRALAELYEDAEHKISINNYLIDKQFDGLGVIALRYDGGSKDAYMKTLELTLKVKPEPKTIPSLPVAKDLNDSECT